MIFIYVPNYSYNCRLNLYILESLRNKNKFIRIKNHIVKIMDATYITQKEKDIIIGVYNRNIRLRWIVNKMIFLWKRRKKSKMQPKNNMTLGFEPIYSLDKERRVDVYYGDTLYTFDYEEIMKHIQICLEAEEYCFSTPKKPFNPYTNIEFTLYQMISIIDRLSDILYKRRRRLPLFLILYREANYDIREFKRSNISLLNIKSCERYIIDMTNEDFEKEFDKFVKDYFYDRLICLRCLKKKYVNYRKIFEPVLIQHTKEVNIGSIEIENQYDKMMVNIIISYNLKKEKMHHLKHPEDCRMITYV